VVLRESGGKKDIDDTIENEAIAYCEEHRAFIIIELEKGIQVEFSGSNFKVGDYWVFYARTATGEIEEGALVATEQKIWFMKAS